MVPQPFAAGGNQSYLEFWAITGDLQYPGNLTPTLAPEPSIKWVAGAGHSMVGRIGTHMLPWALPRDSLARSWGHTHRPPSSGGG
jgi:hypothetical protein